MKKIFMSVMLVIVMLLSMSCTVLAAKDFDIMVSPQTVFVDGKKTNFEVYNINEYNYFKLRDIAYILNGTPSQFSVAYDDATKMISIVRGEPYTIEGGEMSIGEDKSSTAFKSNQSVKVDGVEVNLLAYNLKGNNFFQLRALGTALGFGVDYDEAADSAIIDSNTETVENTLPTTPAVTTKTGSADNIITLTASAPTNAYSTVGYKIGSTTYLGSLVLSTYNDISTSGDIVTVKLLIEANNASSINIKAYCNDTNSEKSSSAPTVEWGYTSSKSKYTPVLVTINKKDLKEYYGLTSNTLYIEASNSSGKTVTLYSTTIPTPNSNVEPEGTTISSEFSIVKGYNGSNITNCYKYAGGQAYAVEYYFTLNTGNYGGTYTMYFPADEGTDACTFTVESNSVYQIKYTYAISYSQNYKYKYSFNVTLSGSQSATLQYSDTHSGKMNKGSISVKKI